MVLDAIFSDNDDDSSLVAVDQASNFQGRRCECDDLFQTPRGRGGRPACLHSAPARGSRIENELSLRSGSNASARSGLCGRSCRNLDRVRRRRAGDCDCACADRCMHRNLGKLDPFCSNGCELCVDVLVVLRGELARERLGDPLLILDRLAGVEHEILDLVDVHVRVNGLESLCALLKSLKDLCLERCAVNLVDHLLNVVEHALRTVERCLLDPFLLEAQQCPLALPLCGKLFCHGRLAENHLVGLNTVLLEIVTLDFELQDCTVFVCHIAARRVRCSRRLCGRRLWRFLCSKQCTHASTRTDEV
eukprot:Amastigsp_a2585_104.p1 type:complete len:305 gc:universal Amastigsp_a2585_104:222-1136(+)